MWRYLEQDASDLHTVHATATPIISCFIKIQNGFTFLVLACSGSPGKEVVKRAVL